MTEQTTLTGRGAEVAIRIGLLVLLVGWCFVIVRPFIGIIGWAVVMSVALYPTFDRLRTLLGGRTKSAAALMTIVFLLVFIVPAVVLSETLVSGVRMLATNLQNGSISIPMPSASVRDWPVIGDRVADLWTLAATNLDALATQFKEEIADMGRWLLGQAASTGLGVAAIRGGGRAERVFIGDSEGEQRHQPTRCAARGRCEWSTIRRTRRCHDAQRRPRCARRGVDPGDAGRARISRGRNSRCGAVGRHCVDAVHRADRARVGPDTGRDLCLLDARANSRDRIRGVVCVRHADRQRAENRCCSVAVSMCR